MINIFGSGTIEVVVGSDVRAWKLQFGLMKAIFAKCRGNPRYNANQSGVSFP